MSTAAVADGAAAAPKKGKMKLIIILSVLVLLLAGGGVGGYIFLMKKNNSAGHADESKAKSHEKKGPPVFAPLEPFTVNLADPGREHYLQIGLTYEVATGDVADALKAQMPLIRSRVLLLLTSRTADELASAQGKSKLATELVALARAALANSGAPGVQNEDQGVADVHFSSFIIQ